MNDKTVKEEKTTSFDNSVGKNNDKVDRNKPDKDGALPYEKKYFALLQRCEIIKQSNERLVNRIHHVRKLLRRRRKERIFLMNRLENYGDDYKTVAVTLFAELIGEGSPSLPSQSNDKSDVSSLSSVIQAKPDS